MHYAICEPTVDTSAHIPYTVRVLENNFTMLVVLTVYVDFILQNDCAL